MPRNREQKQKKDEAIRDHFRKLCKKNPNWKLSAIIQDTADKFFLSPVTIAKILKGKGVKAPDPSTISRYVRKVES
jgi:hypothetical protein